jgi:hypothetical protein
MFKCIVKFHYALGVVYGELFLYKFILISFFHLDSFMLPNRFDRYESFFSNLNGFTIYDRNYQNTTQWIKNPTFNPPINESWTNSKKWHFFAQWAALEAKELFQKWKSCAEKSRFQRLQLKQVKQLHKL